MHFTSALAFLLLIGPADDTATVDLNSEIPDLVAALPAGGCTGTPTAHVPGRNPRFFPDGHRVVFEIGAAGAADLHVLDLDSGAVTPLVVGPGDDCDADPSPDGTRVVFSSNREGTYDLWIVPVTGGEPVRLTDDETDERRPRWSPVPYRLLGVHPDGCGGPYTSLMDDYGKILYERRSGDAVDALWTSDNGLHRGPVGKDCAAPSWFPWGRGILMNCGGRVVALETALIAGIDGAIKASGWSYDTWEADGFSDETINWDPEGSNDAALAKFLRKNPKLKRLYTVYEGRRELSGRSTGLARPHASPNHLLVVAEADSVRARPILGDGDWGTLGLPEDARATAWSPDGRRVAFHRLDKGRDRLYVAATTCPLQSVLNLMDAPDLVADGAPARLDRWGMVARPGADREFFHLYEELRYAGKGILVTPDAMLQVAGDLLAAGIQEREASMTVSLRELTEALWTWSLEEHRVEPKDPARQYMVILFAVPRILLAAGTAQAAALNTDDADCMLYPDIGCPEEELAAWKARRDAAVAAAGSKVLDEVPGRLQSDVTRLIKRVRGASGVGRYEAGALAPQGFAVDWTLFTPRSHYTRPEFRDYFLAMQWFGNLPLPAHPLALRLAAFVRTDPELASRWGSLDAFGAAAVGGAARPTLSHLQGALDAHPRWARKVGMQTLLDDLEGRVGPIPVRGANEVFGYAGMQPYLLPPRLGADVGWIVRLTHPEVDMRGMPSALDVLAALGNRLAVAIAGIPSEGEVWTGEVWRTALSAIRKDLHLRGPGFWTENLFNRWLDTLRILAEDAGIEGKVVPRWVGSPLYRARLLTASLAGLTQLKHHTVLYNMNPMGVECDASSPIVVLYEEPVLPEPPVSVEPHPAFYRALSGLALAAGTAFGQEMPGGVPQELDLDQVRAALRDADWDPGGALFQATVSEQGKGFWRALLFLSGILEGASRRVLDGEPLSPAEVVVARWFGGILERFVLRQSYLDNSMGRGTDQGRAERGVTMVTDIYHNPQRNQVLEIGIGTVDRLFAVVPWLHGEGLVQGGVHSWYEFPEDGAERLTDEVWWERIKAGKLPRRPPWSRLYLQENDL